MAEPYIRICGYGLFEAMPFQIDKVTAEIWKYRFILSYLRINL